MTTNTWYPNAPKICASCHRPIPIGEEVYFEDDEYGHFADLVGYYHKRCCPDATTLSG